MFARVHKSQLSTIGGSIGSAPGDWKIPCMESRQKEIEQVNQYKNNLSENLSTDTRHKKFFGFMAGNGFRQLGPPRINLFADRQRPEPLHLEINNWEHVLNVIYKECISNNFVNELVETLEKPIKEGGVKNHCKKYTQSL